MLASSSADVSAKERQAINLGTNVDMDCKNPGSPQDAAKTPFLINNTGVTIPKGQILSWESTTNEKGTVKLDADLKPGESVVGHGGAGNFYTCKAHFSRMPDLQPTKVTWQGTSSLMVNVTNMDAWVSTEPSIVRVEIMSCSGDVLQSYDSAPAAYAKGETKSLTFPAKYVPGKAYLRVTADASKKVLEHSETNNVYDGSGSCVH